MTELRLGNNIIGKYSLNHIERALKYGRVSDKEIGDYFQVAVDYFGGRCALSGEELYYYMDKKSGKIKSNLSADHVVALKVGGDDIYPNVVPCVLTYNENKSVTHVLDFLHMTKDKNGNTLYSPFRILKLVNYMIRAMDARNKQMTPEQFREDLFSNDEVNRYLTKIEEEKLNVIFSSSHSDGIIRKRIAAEQENECHMNTNVVVSDILELLRNEEMINQDIINSLSQKANSVFNIYDEEKRLRNKIINELEKYQLKNPYTVASILTEQWKDVSYDNFEQISQSIQKRFEELSSLGIEDLQTFIDNTPNALSDENIVERLKVIVVFRPNRMKSLERIDRIDDFIDVLILLKKHHIDIRKTPKKGDVENFLANEGITDRKKVDSILSQVSLITSDKHYKIGGAFDRIQQSDMEELLERTIESQDESGNDYFSEEEKMFLVFGKSTVDNIVNILAILKKNNLNICDIKKDDSVSTLINRSKKISGEQKEKVLSEIRKITNEDDYNIGAAYRTQRIGNYKRFKEKLFEKTDGCGEKIFDEKEILFLTRAQRKHEENATTIDLANVLITLKRYNIDISQIKVKYKLSKNLKDIVQSEGISEAIAKEIEEITGKLDYNIGKEISRYKSKPEVLKKTIHMLDESHLMKYDELDELLERKQSKDAVSDIVEALTVLKKNGVNFTKYKIGRYETLSDFLQKCCPASAEAKRISSQVLNVCFESIEKLGDRITEQRRPRNQKKCQELMKKQKNDDGMCIFSDDEIDSILQIKQIER